MTFIKMGFGKMEEKVNLPEGEYTLIVDDYDVLEEEDAVRIRHVVEGHPEAATVWHRLNLVTKDDDKEKANWKLLFNAAYLNLFGIGYTNDGFDPDDLQGASAKCKLIIEEYEGEPKNVIKLRVKG